MSVSDASGSRNLFNGSQPISTRSPQMNCAKYPESLRGTNNNLLLVVSELVPKTPEGLFPPTKNNLGHEGIW